MTAWQAFEYLERVRDELESAAFSVGRTLREVRINPTILSRRDYPLRVTSIKSCADRLEATYVIQLFAEFEGILRDYWGVVRPGRAPRTRMELLMDRIAARRYMPTRVLAAAHEVREFRNSLVHEHVRATMLTFRDCQRALSIFVSYLPRQW